MLLALVLAVIPTYGPLPSASPAPPAAYLRVPVTGGEALIVDSGSTNRAGYRLRVYASGWSALQQGDVAIKKHLPVELVKRFFADLNAAGPLDRLPTARCMKSISFGSSTRVAYRDKMSPDLACPSSAPAVRALAIDVSAVTAAAGVSMIPVGAPRRPL
jgi:hypothetical protein